MYRIVNTNYLEMEADVNANRSLELRSSCLDIYTDQKPRVDFQIVTCCSRRVIVLETVRYVTCGIFQNSFSPHIFFIS